MKANIRSSLAFFSLALQLLLGLMAFMALALFFLYPHVSRGRSATYEAQVLSSAQAGIKALLDNEYRRLDVAVAWKAEIFPPNMNLEDGTIQNQWGGQVRVGPAMADGTADNNKGPANFFYMEYPHVPPDECIGLVLSVTQNFGGVWVNDTLIQNTYQIPISELREEQVTAACKLNQTGARLLFLSN